NPSTQTLAAWAKAGPLVAAEPLQGKGNVVRRMFADIEADLYVLVDGDDTYAAAVAPAMIAALEERQLDMVNVSRVPDRPGQERLGHAFGNRVLTGLVRRI